MQKTENKTNNSVKSKLIAAIAMLLVATIMVVSSTYAWFTLSTKPEVTGISTAVGANGALEMLLLTKDANGELVYKDGVVPANAPWSEKNTYWGNLVNLSDNNYYGTDKITLYPSKLNVENGAILGTPISFPKYGSDGRVEKLQPGGGFGTFDGTSFYENENYGFRALGVASGLTARQQNFRVALAQIAVHQGTAKSEARDSLSANGTQLAAIAVKKGMNTSTTYAKADSDAVKAMLAGIEKSLIALENAYIQALYTAVYSNLNTSTDAEVDVQIAAIRAKVDAATGLGAKIAAGLAIADVEASTLSGYDVFTDAVAAFATAKTAIDALQETGELSVLIDALRPLVNVENVEVNGRKANEIGNDTSALAADILTNGAKVAIKNGGGVYADVAELCGQYNVSITIPAEEIAPGTLSGLDFPADMIAGESVNGTLNTLRNVLNTKEPTATGAVNPISEFYGYVIDLAFRTNASQSDLLLQTTPEDRIYTDNQNEATLGKGSTMTFNTDFTAFKESQVKSLMSHIKLVFFDTDTYTVLKYAALDATNAKKTDDGLEANIYLVNGDQFVTEKEDAVIKALDTNVRTNVSVLVYLDGETLTNADVAATLVKSMSGKLNLQFASSASLVPMDYADLHQKTPANN